MDRLRKVCRLTRSEWAVVSHAILLLPLAAVAVRCLRLDRAARLVAVAPGPASAPGQARAAALAALIDGVGRAIGASCLTRSVVLHALLVRQGGRPVIVIGAARVGGRLRAHAWVEHLGRSVGPTGADGCTPLCRVEPAGVRPVLPA